MIQISVNDEKFSDVNFARAKLSFTKQHFISKEHYKAI